MSVGWGMPILARVAHIPLPQQLPLVGITGLFISGFTVLGGHLADRYGRRRTYVTCSLLLVAAAPAYVALLLSYMSPSRLWALYLANALVLGGLYGTLQGVFPGILADLFPPPLRYSGMSLIHHASGLHAPAFFPLIARALLGPTDVALDTRKADPTNLCVYVAAAALVSTIAAGMLQVRPPPKSLSSSRHILCLPPPLTSALPLAPPATVLTQIPLLDYNRSTAPCVGVSRRRTSRLSFLWGRVSIALAPLA
jgi:MFS family permease